VLNGATCPHPQNQTPAEAGFTHKFKNELFQRGNT
jgi:hypothetical protein